MKYAHLADAHLGSWRDQKMRNLSTKSFLTAIEDCIIRKVDFIVFAGDLFNTSLPSLDILKTITKKLKELQQENIPFYLIPGSHDFSPSGKTMLDVLENAGLVINVCKGEVKEGKLNLKFTQNQKTGAKITGMLGKKGMLDRVYYENLELSNLEKEPGYKIFMFHTTLSELKPKHLEMIESQPLSFLPKNFNYYAGGHLHHKVLIKEKDYPLVSYPGALFPNNFQELEKYSHGGYYLVGDEIEWIPVKVINHIPIKIDCSNKIPEVIAFDILNPLNSQDLRETVITIRLEGKLNNGKISDINFKNIFSQLEKQNAYFVMKNTSKLKSEEFEEIKIETSSPEKIEEELIKEHLQQIKLFDQETEFKLAKDLIQYLNTNKKEGETTKDFQERVKEELDTILELKEEMI